MGRAYHASPASIVAYVLNSFSIGKPHGIPKVIHEFLRSLEMVGLAQQIDGLRIRRELDLLPQEMGWQVVGMFEVVS